MKDHQVALVQYTLLALLIVGVWGYVGCFAPCDSWVMRWMPVKDAPVRCLRGVP